MDIKISLPNVYKALPFSFGIEARYNRNCCVSFVIDYTGV